MQIKSQERELLIKLHKAYYEGKSGYDKAWDKGNELADIRFKKEDDKLDRRLTKQERTLRYIERRTSPEADARNQMRERDYQRNKFSCCFKR